MTLLRLPDEHQNTGTDTFIRTNYSGLPGQKTLTIAFSKSIQLSIAWAESTRESRLNAF